MSVADPVLQVVPLGAPPWPTIDPFLFCVHHDDAFPVGNDAMGPAGALTGRDLGQDFAGIDGWRMYHGRTVPGFPQHPHRGFETVTVARRGLIDHSDSLGATARFGRGDAQWMTAGRGIVHAEMFPLLDQAAPNPAELFQIWINLPAEDKMVDPHFTMMWNDAIPTMFNIDNEGCSTEVTVVAGGFDGLTAVAPPPHSWAARPDTDVAVWTIRMAPGARWTLPAALRGDAARVLYLFDGSFTVEARRWATDAPTALALDPRQSVTFSAGPAGAECLLLQGRPIGEPVAQYGPFVMNDRAGIEQAYRDYERTRFGGWPWTSDDPVHSRPTGRFAIHADGRREVPA